MPHRFCTLFPSETALHRPPHPISCSDSTNIEETMWPFPAVSDYTVTFQMKCRDWDCSRRFLCSVCYYDEWCSLNGWEYQLAVNERVRLAKLSRSVTLRNFNSFIISSFISSLNFWLLEFLCIFILDHFFWLWSVILALLSISRHRFIIENDGAPAQLSAAELQAHLSPWKLFPIMPLSLGAGAGDRDRERSFWTARPWEGSPFLTNVIMSPSKPVAGDWLAALSSDGRSVCLWVSSSCAPC